MATRDDYVDHVLDLLVPVARCTSRKMFGGEGVFLDGNMIGLVQDGRLYLKVDDETRPSFEQAGGEPFVYDNHGRRTELSYVSPPDEAFDSPAAMGEWGRLAAQAAGRAAYGRRGKAGKSERPVAAPKSAKPKKPSPKPRPRPSEAARPVAAPKSEKRERPWKAARPVAAPKSEKRERPWKAARPVAAPKSEKRDRPWKSAPADAARPRDKR